MIHRELPLTTDASPAEPVANFRRGFSVVLAPAAADSVLELDNVVHWLIRFCFFLIWKVFAFVLRFSSRRQVLPGCRRFGLDSDRPDEAQQLSCNRRHDLPLLLAGAQHRHITLVQSMLCLPGYFGDLCRNPLVPFAQLFPDAGQVSIAPGRFDHDSSEVGVAGLGDAASSNALATGVFARKHSAIA